MHSKTTGQRGQFDTKDLPLRAAAQELGLWPRELELAVRTEQARTVPGAPGAPRRVAYAEVERLRGTAGFPESLRARLRLVGAGEGAKLMGISVSRFARLARLGHFGPVKFYVNRYRTVVWLYLAHELRELTRSGAASELLRGRMPQHSREALEAGLDERARRWRSRRVRQLETEAGDPWELAAVRASVLDEDTLAEAVPERDERVRLRALAPFLVETRSESEAVRDAGDTLGFADGEEEVHTYVLGLRAALEEARATAPMAAFPPATPTPVPVAERPGPESEHPVSGPPLTGARRRWSLRGRRPKPATRPVS